MQSSTSTTSSAPKPMSARKQRKAKIRAVKKMAKKVKRTGKALKLEDGTKISLAGDARTAVGPVDTLASAGQQPTITIEVPLSIEQITGVCVEYVSYALSRGYLAASDDPSYPYWAFVYMANVLVAYVTGGTPKATALPLWLQELGQAMQPKKVKFGKGLIYYKFLLFPFPVPYIPPANVPIGSFVYGYEWLAYVLGNSNVDGFPTAAPPGGYTDAQGAQAWLSLAQFMQVEQIPRSRVIPLKTTYWAKNVSAFAMATIPEGLGWNGSGGMAVTAGLEVPILTPVLSTLVGSLAEGSVSAFRYGNRPVVTSGDALFASGWFSHIAYEKHLSMKRPTRFHFVDFLEFQAVTAAWVQAVVQAALTDPVNTGNVNPDWYRCPLTLQEMGLVLRNEMMCMFGATQTAVQSIYPRAPKQATDNEFVPFVAGSTTVGIQSSGMKLPLPLVEDAKSMLCRVACHGEDGSDPECFCPVLGQYTEFVLNPSDYTAVTAAGDTIPVFATLSEKVNVKRRNSKGAEDWVPFAEAPISFIDGTSGSNYVFINDVTRLGTLTALWNEWAIQLAAYSDPYSTCSRDLGVNISVSLGSTRHWIDVPLTEKIRNTDFVDLRVKARSHMLTPYANREAIGVSSHDRIISAAFDEITKIWILPTNHSTTGIGLDDNTPIQRVQIINEEPFRIAISAGDSGQTLSSLHMIFAQKMVHGRNGDPSDLARFFLDQEKQGHGGILSGLVAGFLGKQFGPTVGSIASAVSDMIPI